MPTCEDCGGHVTERYRAVFFAPEQPTLCPDCVSFHDLSENNIEVHEP